DRFGDVFEGGDRPHFRGRNAELHIAKLSRLSSGDCLVCHLVTDSEGEVDVVGSPHVVVRHHAFLMRIRANDVVAASATVHSARYHAISGGETLCAHSSRESTGKIWRNPPLTPLTQGARLNVTVGWHNPPAHTPGGSSSGWHWRLVRQCLRYVRE